MDTIRPIRNNKGKLVCNIEFDGERWNVFIKNHDTMTILELTPTGEANLLNYTYMK